MHQLIVILIAVLFIPVLLKFKVPVGPTLMIMGAAAGLLGGLSIPTVGMAFANVFLVPSTLSSVFVVVEVGMLSSLMMSSGLLERMDQAVRKLIPNTKVVLCIMPALIGALQAPGGASLSAPIANKLGKELGLTPAQRANINTICRHFLVLFTPFAVNLLVVQSVAPQVNILTLGAYNFGFVLLMQICGIWLMLHGVKNVQLPAVPAGEKPAALKEFLITFSPVILIFILNTLLGVSFPIAVVAGMVLVWFIGDHTAYAKQVVNSFSSKLALLIIGVYFFQNIVSSMDDLIDLFQSLISGRSDLVFLVMVALVGTLFGMATGLMYLPLGVLVPIVVGASYVNETSMMIHLFYTFIWCFIGYYFSPIHLCQLLSDQECGATPGERYRSYLPMILLLPVFVVVLYLVYTAVLV